MSLPALDADEFAPFFEEIHHVAPFRWQRRLAATIARTGRWPAVLALPTGCGKTAVLDIAVFQLALDAPRGTERRAPVRVALVVDRRLIVDDAYRRAQLMATALASGSSDVVGRVAARLRLLAGDGLPLLTGRLRGGVPREDDWARTPSQPTVLCSTVDQVGSRLLFRGYGISDRARPIHAGLLGADCRIFLDEAHLAEPFRQTLRWIERYSGEDWREGPGSPWGVTVLTATPRDPEGPGHGASDDVFALEPDDYDDPGLRSRWLASKPARLVSVGRRGRPGAADPGPGEGEAPGDGGGEAGGDDARVSALCAEVERGLAVLRERGMTAPAIGVVVNRVVRARAVFARLGERLGPDACQRILLIGPARPVEREDLVAESLAPIRTGADRALDRALVVVATQCIEAGVDLDLDGLVSELAPVDALRQRFGRLNRGGRAMVPFAAIVAPAADLGPRYDDPVYGRSLKPAWDYLTADGASASIDLGLAAFEEFRRRRAIPPEACSEAPDAPVLMPAHVDVLAQTSPSPDADLEVALYLHGPHREPASVSVVWRADVQGQGDAATRRLLLLLPPRAAEAIVLPVWSVRSWLSGSGRNGNALADVPSAAPDSRRDGRARSDLAPRVFRWAGDDERSQWIGPDRIRPGDTIVVPSHYGGADPYGWDPARRPAGEPQDGIWVSDLAERAAEPFAGRRFVVRVGPGLLFDPGAAAAGETAAAARERHRVERLRAATRARRLRDRLADVGSGSWRDVLEALRGLDFPAPVQQALQRLEQANPRRVDVDLEAYGLEDGRPRGAVFVAPLGLPSAGEPVTPDAGSTEDDHAGSMPGFVETLGSHSERVEDLAADFARRCGLSEPLVADLRLAGFLHDAGKADRRFQALLAAGDPLGPDGTHLLAKSGRRVPRGSSWRAGLPAAWRHEALSVRLAERHPRFAPGAGQDPDLVLWLIGTHHGWGRPFFPHADALDGTTRAFPPLLGAPPMQLPAGPGPQSFAFDVGGTDWAGLFARLRARYGVWELSRLEAILRLADHRASEAARHRSAGRDPA